MVLQFEYRSDPDKTGQATTWQQQRLAEAEARALAAMRAMPQAQAFGRGMTGRKACLIDDILTLKAELVAVGWRTGGYAQGLRPDIHLYAPLLASEKIRIQPVSLNASEFRFVDDLRQWLLANAAALEDRHCRLFLLRNLVRRGVGFFEAGNFYPDFILWCLNADGSQRIVFIDPHGLEHEGPGSDKIALASEIKKLEQRLNDPTVTLESAILLPGNNRMKVEHLWTMRGQARPGRTRRPCMSTSWPRRATWTQ